MNFFSDDLRRDSFPAYDQVRSASPVLPVPDLDLWMIFDYDGVKQAMTDYEAFISSPSKANSPDPRWLVFFDPPRHTKLRALIMRAFTPRIVANLEPRIQQFSHELIDRALGDSEMDIIADFAEPLPIMVIAGMLGIPGAEWRRFRRWSDVIVTSSSLAIPGGAQWAATAGDMALVTAEIKDSLREWIAERRATPKDDLLTALVQAEVDGERLSDEELLGFLQLLLIAGTETTTNLIGNAILCFTEHPTQLTRLRQAPELLPLAIEEVLRYRSPVQWMLRFTARDVEIGGHFIPAGKRVLIMIGSANRDPKHFADPGQFDIARNPNPHIAFGHGTHFCIGAPLSRLESRVALSVFLDRVASFDLSGPQTWAPCKALHLHGTASLPVVLQANMRATRGHVG
ncbi:MAG: cytochrome P450 [Bryobacteraceae bacterium]